MALPHPCATAAGWGQALPPLPPAPLDAGARQLHGLLLRALPLLARVAAPPLPTSAAWEAARQQEHPLLPSLLLLLVLAALLQAALLLAVMPPLQAQQSDVPWQRHVPR